LTQRRVATDDDPDTIVDVAAAKLGSSSKQKSMNALDTFRRFRRDVFYHVLRSVSAILRQVCATFRYFCVLTRCFFIDSCVVTCCFFVDCCALRHLFLIDDCVVTRRFFH